MDTKTNARKTLIALCMSMLCAVAFAQVRQITGTVVDGIGEPIIGANVLEVGTTNGVITDIDGNFRLDGVQPSSEIQITYIGYIPQTIKVGNQTNFKVTLKEDSQALDEVVVIGYGVVKKRDLTGSVASVKSDDIEKVAATNALQAMQAKVPGLDLSQGSGEAGSSLSMTLRGNRSITASNSPLVLVDGVEYGSTVDIPASEIESMEVLKDASSTAIYGTKGANGVIIITTKRGSAGKTQVNFNAYWSFNSPTKTAKPMYGDAEVQRVIDKSDYQNNYATYAETGTWGTASASPEDVLTESLSDGTTQLEIYNDKSYTDWIDLLLKNSLTQNYELSVTGGSEKTNFNVAVSAMKNNGIMKNDNLNRYTGRINIDHTINSWAKVGSSITYMYRSNDARNSSVYSQALKMTTITHAYLSDGSINATPNPWYNSHCSPLLDEVEGAYQKNTESTRFFGNVYAQLTPMKGLVFKTLFSLSRRNTRTGLYQDYESQARYQSPATSYISNEQASNIGYTWQNTLNYNTNFNDIHDLTILLGHEMSQSVDESISIAGDAGKEHYYTSAFYDVSKITSPTTTTTYEKQSMLSFFARANYKFMERYLLTASLRADGSSVLADGHKWGYFPSVAVAWRINEESFMANTRDWLDNLKFRVSYGISGNAAIDPYQTIATLTSSIPSGTDMIPASMGNEDLSWETTHSLNFGLDFGVLSNRISGSIDYYINKTKDLLYYKSAPASSVYTSTLANVGESSGQGIEVAVNAIAIQKKDFTWELNLSYTHSTDKLEKLADGSDRNIDGTDALIVGEPLSIYYDYETNGIWGIGEYDQYVSDMASQGVTVEKPLSSYGDPGTVKIVDRNGDGQITDDDKRVYNRSPKHIMGLNTTLTYKDWSLGIQFYARLGGYMEYGMNSQLNYESANWGDIDYWTPTNTGAKFPSPGLNSDQQSTYSTYKTAFYWEKADYFKIKDITLTYSVPKTLSKKVGIANARIYASMKNFLTWSSVDNYDSERGGSISFPLQKQFILGLNLQF
ncbi:MAG: TonB-dependent receptor [Bacteroides sp.]|nr:TonB-dependent receptor [Bacteroides sp.]